MRWRPVLFLLPWRRERHRMILDFLAVVSWTKGEVFLLLVRKRMKYFINAVQPRFPLPCPTRDPQRPPHRHCLSPHHAFPRPWRVLLLPFLLSLLLPSCLLHRVCLLVTPIRSLRLWRRDTMTPQGTRGSLTRKRNGVPRSTYLVDARIRLLLLVLVSEIVPQKVFLRIT